MSVTIRLDQPRFRVYGRKQINALPQLEDLSRDQMIALKAVSAVLPFRVNSYVLEELIDWDEIPNDPIYQLTFPQAGMLDPRDYVRMQDLVLSGASDDELKRAARPIQMRMNPHPAGQMELNVPSIDGQPLPGCQHKYRETVLFFPAAGQTCHAYCTYCFRWAQFVGQERFRFASNEVDLLARYLRSHREVSDVLVTGGDPMIMGAKVLRRHVEPLLGPGLEHITTIRVGTKALSYWPYRFTTDRDAGDLLRMFEKIRSSGRQIALMAHFSHPRELETRAVSEAIRRIQSTGTVIRCQAPLARHVNDSAEIWAEMWRTQVRLGLVPYYMFVERNTGPKHYFEVPLARALRIFNDAYRQLSGLARTVRGPSMSALPGKVQITGVATVAGENVFVLKVLQGRDPEWVGKVFLARFDSQAAWLTELEPAFGEREFFYECRLREMAGGTWQPDWQRDEIASCEGA
jgi:KamA family protein